MSTANPLFNIEDKYELLAMHRALFTAKFALESPAEFAGSPLLAAVCERAVVALQQHGVGGSDQSWIEWLQAERHPEQLTFVRQRLAECLQWQSWSIAERQEYVRLLLSPLHAGPNTKADLLSYADACHPNIAV